MKQVKAELSSIKRQPIENQTWIISLQWQIVDNKDKQLDALKTVVNSHAVKLLRRIGPGMLYYLDCQNRKTRMLKSGYKRRGLKVKPTLHSAGYQSRKD